MPFHSFNLLIGANGNLKKQNQLLIQICKLFLVINTIILSVFETFIDPLKLEPFHQEHIVRYNNAIIPSNRRMSSSEYNYSA